MTQDDMINITKASGDLAAIIVNYYMELKRLGLDDNAAIAITCGYQKQLIPSPNLPPNER